MNEHICYHIGDAPASSILIVDDKPENLRLLSGILREQGYGVRTLRKGSMVLSSVLNSPPDLILLDIMMPETDGYEVCSQLKADEKTCKIPVIFISALNTFLRLLCNILKINNYKPDSSAQFYRSVAANAMYIWI